MKRTPYIKKGREYHGMKGEPTDQLYVAHDDVDGLRELRMEARDRDDVSAMPLNTPQCIGCGHFMGNHNGARCFVGGCGCG